MATPPEPMPASEPTTAAPDADRKPIEHWREVKRTEPWLYAAMKAYRHWGIGSLATEAEYDRAASETAGIRVQ